MARFVFQSGLALNSALGYPKTLVRIVWLYVKDPMNSLFTATIEDETIEYMLFENCGSDTVRFAAQGDSRRFDSMFNQVSFAGLFDINLVMDERLMMSVSRNPAPGVW